MTFYINNEIVSEECFLKSLKKDFKIDNPNVSIDEAEYDIGNDIDWMITGFVVSYNNNEYRIDI